MQPICPQLIQTVIPYYKISNHWPTLMSLIVSETQYFLEGYLNPHVDQWIDRKGIILVSGTVTQVCVHRT